MAKKKEEKPKTSSTFSSIFLVVSLVVSAAIVAAVIRSYVRDKAQAASIYYGDISDFERPACVIYRELIEATPEHRELSVLLEQKKLDRGDPEVRTLLSAAADRVANAVSTFAQENDCDLVAELSYWEKHAPRGTVAGNVTAEIIEIIQRQSGR